MILTTSRTLGLFYVGIVITGVFAFLYTKAQLFVAGDAAATALNLVTQSDLARVGIASELLLVMFQALVAVWFFKLFHKVNLFASVALLTFGTVNAMLILMASVFWFSAFTLANNTISPDNLENARNVFQLFEVHGSIWTVGQLFFGLWLMPMGYLAGKARMPRLLSWTLIGGGVGYILALFIEVLAPGFPSSVIEMITIPATVGEFWMIGYLLTKKVRVE